MKRKRIQVKDEKENSNIEISHDNFPNHASHLSDKEKDVFDEIFDNDQIISIPISWGRTNFSWGENNTPAIHFHKLVGRKGKTGHVESVYQKEITIDKNMTLLIKVNGVQVDHKAFEIESDHLNSAANLMDVINIIEKREICQGCPDITPTSDNYHLLKSFTYVDKSDIIRNNHCLLLLPTDNNENSNSCKSCKSVKTVLNKKIIRRQQNKNKNYLRINDLSPRKKAKLLKLKRQLDYKGRTIERAKVNIRLLKNVVHRYQNKIIGVSENALNDLIDKQNISKNEKLAIQQILKASKAKDPKGRRYELLIDNKID